MEEEIKEITRNDFGILPVDFDTDKFRQEAIRFQKTGTYCSEEKGTRRYKEYWDQQIEYCLDGIEIDGVSITGYHYFYLNFCRIKQVVKKPVQVRGKWVEKKMKVYDFPRFYDYDKFYFDSVEKAALNGEHFVVLKARRKGYSFKCAAMLCRNFYLIRNSVNYVIAGDKQFLIGDGILTKVTDYLNFIDQHTAWGKRRQVSDTIMHRKASYIENVDGKSIEKGYKSEIIGVTIKNDAQKLRGISCNLILFEEAGKNPELLEAFAVVESSMSQGVDTYGQAVLFGTGGTVGADFEGIRELFYNPKAYNIFSMENIWDVAQTEPCGFFVPDFAHLEGFITPNGISLISDARDYRLQERKKKEQADPGSIDRYISEHPFTPAEAVLQSSGNIFPQKLLMEQLNWVETDDRRKKKYQTGTLRFDEKGNVKFDYNGSLKPILDFPLKEDRFSEGCVMIWEHPFLEDDGMIPKGMYIAGIDPYDHDQSTTSSLGSVFVFKRFYSPQHEYNILVAEYTGRPETADEFYEITRMLLLYYNATALYENNIKGLHKYFTQKRSEYLLADTPETKDVIKETKVQRGKGIHMTKEIISWSEKEIKKYLLEYDGKRYGWQKIYSVPLLKELISYNIVGNFDRVRSLGCLMIYLNSLYAYKVKKQKREETFFPKNPFVKTIDNFV